MSDIAFVNLDHGLLASVNVPADIPPGVWKALHQKERAYAMTLQARRQLSWVAGRASLRAALDHLGISSGPILTHARGRPLLPPGVTGSITHKDGRATALVLESAECNVGVDLEMLDRQRDGIETRILTPFEHREWEDPTADQRWKDLLIRFSLKEAIYKAIDPFLGRWVGFEEVSVSPRANGAVEVNLHLQEPLRVKARWAVRDNEILTTARACRRTVR